jgi:predicted mannosyl-3-phosphoglycerate phosphatase (HAD superfamily)
MKEFVAAIRTNENGARTKTLIAAGITVAAVAAGIYLTKKNAAVPVVLITSETVAEAVTDAAQ